MFDWFVTFSNWFRSDMIVIGSFVFSPFDIWLWSFLGGVIVWAFNKFLDF